MLDYSILNDKRHIWISLSGGADSALFLYLIIKYLYTKKIKLQITPWTIIDTTRPGNDKNVEKIIEVINDIYPYHINDPVYNHITKYEGESKKELVKPHWDNMKKSGLYDLFCNALSASPPIEEMKKIEGFYEAFARISDEDRSPEIKKPEIIKDKTLTIWTPLINKNKKDLAQIYEEEDLIFNLFPHTASCVDRYKTPCKKCFWCHEKLWAFDSYDIYGVKFKKNIKKNKYK